MKAGKQVALTGMQVSKKVTKTGVQSAEGYSTGGNYYHII